MTPGRSEAARDRRRAVLAEQVRARLREVHWTNTREMLVYLQYDEWDTYIFYKRFEDGDEQEVVVEGTLDVERIPAWGKVRAHSDLRLGVVTASKIRRNDPCPCGSGK